MKQPHPIRVGRLLVICWALLLVVGFADTARAEGKRWALLLGIDGYFDLTSLTHSSTDTYRLESVLKNRCGFDHVIVIADKHPERTDSRLGLNLRKDELKIRIEKFLETAQSASVDTVMIYFSGHGVLPDDNSDLLLCAIDAKVRGDSIENVISRNWLEVTLSSVNIPEKMLVLDCCHAAEQGKGFGIRVKEKPNADEVVNTQVNSSNNFVVLASSLAEQKSQQNVFTREWIAGLEPQGGFAEDTNQSETLDVDELFEHAKKSMLNGPKNQQPVLRVVSGKAAIPMAPAPRVVSPTWSVSAYVHDMQDKPVADVQVSMTLAPASESKKKFALATATTNANGEAKLIVPLPSSGKQAGDFQLEASHAKGKSSTNLNAFVGRSNQMFIMRLIPETPVPAVREEMPIPPAPPAAEPKSVVEQPEPTFAEIFDYVKAYIADKQISSICAFKLRFPTYRHLIDSLDNSEKFQVDGLTVCFPNQTTWARNPELRKKIIEILRENGVVPSKSSPKSLPQVEPVEFEVAKQGAFAFVRAAKLDICGLNALLPGYQKVIDQLDRSEKYQVLGLPICFPSQETWESRRDVSTTITAILIQNGILPQK